MNVHPISGYGAKGPACFLVKCHGRKLLLDLGEGPEPGRLPDIGSIGCVDAILISHGHKDHIGGLHLTEHIGSPPIYATDIVKALHPEKLGGAHDLPLSGSISICGVAVETGRASHAPGGIWMRVGGEDGVLYTGDWTTESLLYPLDPMPRARLLIVDAAYGAYDEPVSMALDRLVEAARTGDLLLPMPPDGRGLDVAVALLDHGIVPSLCSSHMRMAKTLIKHFPESLMSEGRSRLQALVEQARVIDADTSPSGVLIAADASANGGCAKKLIDEYEADTKFQIVFTGYVPKDSTAHKLVNSGRAEHLRWNVHPRLSDVKAMLKTVLPGKVYPAFLPEDQLSDYSALLQSL